MRPKDAEKEQAIRTVALQIIAEEGLENLSMQKLATAANVSPRTIYLKYENKEDFLVKLFIDEVLGAYETAVLTNFDQTAEFASGMRQLWRNGFHFFRDNRPALALMLYGRSSPLLNKAFQEKGIGEGQFFAPVHRFLARHAADGTIVPLPHEAHRALLFFPLLDLMNEHFEHGEASAGIITEDVVLACCGVIVNGMRIATSTKKTEQP